MKIEEYCKTFIKEYPEYVTKEQMYRICHISKKTCQYLLENGMVPCIDTGKKTRRYKIKTSDIADYLMQRESKEAEYKPTAGFYRNKCNRESIISKILKTDRKWLREIYMQQLLDFPDVMSVEQTVSVTGYGFSSIIRRCKSGRLKSFHLRNVYKIPKEYLLE